MWILESSRLEVGYMQFLLLTAPGPMHFHYRDSNFTIAIITVSILLLSTNDDITVDSIAMFPVLVYTFTLTTSSSAVCMASFNYIDMCYCKCHGKFIDFILSNFTTSCTYSSSQFARKCRMGIGLWHHLTLPSCDPRSWKVPP